MILVTGASGFVGRALCAQLLASGTAVIGVVRKDAASGEVAIGALRADNDWRAALVGCDAVIHLAARVHVMDELDSDPLRAYREVNVEATLNLARQAALAGVKRFVFVSSVKVNGEATNGTPFSAADVPRPCDPYGRSKLEAELALQALARATGLEVVIVRPPLVYGPGVKANFLNLMKMVRRGLPLPLASVRNRRSMVALDNLVDLLIVCAHDPRAAGATFMVSDGHDVSISELIRMLADAMGRPARLVPVPVGVLAAAARLVGKAATADRLMGSLQVDIAHTRARLGWAPVVEVQAAVDLTVRHFLKSLE